MKCVTVQYLEALARLKKNGVKLLRTVHCTILPDEEIGGADGMGKFCESKEFAELNVGFALDEGLANPSDTFTIFYGERLVWWITVVATGNTGHASRFIENTAIEKLNKVINKVLAYRDQQKKILCDVHDHGCNLKLGDVTTVNLTYLKGGITTDGIKFQMNVVPDKYEAGFDCRITPTTSPKEFTRLFNEWTQQDKGVEWHLVECSRPDSKLTDISPSNLWWTSVTHTFEQLGLKYETEIFPAGTDSCYLRNNNIPAIGFSPINDTPILLHDHNEFLNEKIFLRGIDIYYELIQNLAKTPGA